MSSHFNHCIIRCIIGASNGDNSADATSNGADCFSVSDGDDGGDSAYKHLNQPKTTSGDGNLHHWATARSQVTALNDNT